MYEFLNELELEKNDTLLVASNIIPLALSIKNFDPNDLINELQKRVSTLLFPAFNYEFCEGKAFDYKNTKPSTGMGSLALAAFRRDDFKRTTHPVFSFMVWGKYQKDFVSLKNIDAFSMDSPFGLLYKLKAKMLFIDIDYNSSFTYVHFVEHQQNAFYRYHKEFKGEYIKDNKKEFKTYRLFVRDLEKGVVNNINPTGDILEKKGLVKIYKFFNDKSIWKLLNLYDVYKEIAYQVKNNPFNLMSLKGRE
jgi:aminoglycoside 3-N-acetyltransferase